MTLREKLERTLTVQAFNMLAKRVKKVISHNGWAGALNRTLGANPTESVMTIAKVLSDWSNEKFFAEEILSPDIEIIFNRDTEKFEKRILVTDLQVAA